MQSTSRFLSKLACQITLFTRENCSLCTDAKNVLSGVWDRRPFVYQEVDVMKVEGRVWKGVYEFDTPVIHVSKASEGEERLESVGKATKLMHRFTKEEVLEKMDLVESR